MRITPLKLSFSINPPGYHHPIVGPTLITFWNIDASKINSIYISEALLGWGKTIGTDYYNMGWVSCISQNAKH